MEDIKLGKIKILFFFLVAIAYNFIFCPSPVHSCSGSLLCAQLRWSLVSPPLFPLHWAVTVVITSCDFPEAGRGGPQDGARVIGEVPRQGQPHGHVCDQSSHQGPTLIKGPCAWDWMLRSGYLEILNNSFFEFVLCKWSPTHNGALSHSPSLPLLPP